MSAEPVRPIYNRFKPAIEQKAAALTTPELVRIARAHNRCAINNTATGAWLEVVLRRIEAEHQSASGQCQ